MITFLPSFLYTIIFAIISNECSVAGGIFSSKKQNIDELKYHGASITFACVTDRFQIEFHVVEIEQSVPPELIDILDNGRGLSIFFHGVGNEIIDKSGSLYRFAEEWFNKSGNNICTVTYPYKNEPETPCEWFSSLNNLVKTKRLHFAAKMARDLVMAVREKCVQSKGRRVCLRNMSHVDVSGFSFGAHMAGRTCQYILEKTGEKVRMLLALDPSRQVPIFGEKIKDSIKRGYAEYVQVIHSSGIIALMEQLGDVDIYVKQNKELPFLESIIEKHHLALDIHMSTATKRLFLIADENEKRNGSIVKRDTNVDISYIEPKPNANECLVGIYSKMRKDGKTSQLDKKGKKYTIRLDRSDISDIVEERSSSFDFAYDDKLLDELMQSLNMTRSSPSSHKY